MKNLKKVLSLALVFAMVLGLCIGAMAANTQDVTTLSDWGNVTHKEAAQLLNAFNIMQGYPDKTYRPTNTVTRAEAVKMIDVGLWGGVDQPDRFIGSEKTFSDVKNSDWYAGHVTYAQALGILDGFPDGTFRPNDTVTGYQMLKMALIALNYSSEVEGLTGAGWDIRTMRLATDPSSGYNGSLTNLTAGLSDITDWNAPLTRDQAAQIIYNMIMHSYISYNLDRNGQVGNIKDYTKGTFGSVYLGLNTQKGVLAANQYGSVTKGFAVDPSTMNTYAVSIDPVDKSNCIIAEEDTENVLIATTGYIPAQYVDGKLVDGTGIWDAGSLFKATVTSTIDDLGSPVTIYTKNGYPVAVAIDSKTEVTPTYSADFTKITNADREIGEVVPTTISVTYGYEEDSKDNPVVGTGAYEDTTAYDVDGDGRIDYMTTKAYSKPAEVKAVTTTNKHGDVYQVNSYGWRSGYEDSALNSKNFVATDTAGFTAKKGDVIAYNTLVNAFNKVASYGVVLDAVAGKIDRVNTTATQPTGWYVNVDGVQYFLEGYTDKKDVPGFGSEGTAYTYPDGKIGMWAGKTTQVDTKYAVIYDAGYALSSSATAIGGNNGVAVQVSAILDTGDSGVYNVASITVPNTTDYVSVPTHGKDADGKIVTPDFINIPVSAFTYDNITDNQAQIKVDDSAMTAKVNSTVKGFFFNGDSGVDGILFNIDNTKNPTKGGTSDQTYALVTYTVNDDGSLNLSVIGKTSKDKPTDIQPGTTITANSPSLGGTYFKSSTLTFTQTEQTYVGGGTSGDVAKETWTVVTGLPTTSYKLANKNAQAYIKNYFTDQTADTGAFAFVVEYQGIASAPATTPFLYVLNNNGRTGTYNNAAVYLLDVYNAETDTIEQIEVANKNANTITAGQFFTNYTAATKTIGDRISLSLTNKNENAANANGVVTAPCVGFITSIQDGVIGLTKVSSYQTKSDGEERKTTSEAFVVDKDTKFYVIDGDKTAKTDINGIGAQEVLDWYKIPETATTNRGGTIRYYQTVIIPTYDNTAKKTTNVAAHVIVFMTEQGEQYTSDGAVYTPTSR